MEIDQCNVCYKTFNIMFLTGGVCGFCRGSRGADEHVNKRLDIESDTKSSVNSDITAVPPHDKKLEQAIKRAKGEANETIVQVELSERCMQRLADIIVEKLKS